MKKNIKSTGIAAVVLSIVCVIFYFLGWISTWKQVGLLFLIFAVFVVSDSIIDIIFKDKDTSPMVVEIIKDAVSIITVIAAIVVL